MTVSSMGFAYVLNVGIVSRPICLNYSIMMSFRASTRRFFGIIPASREAVCAARGHSPENGKGKWVS